jgi:hypothetical protein
LSSRRTRINRNIRDKESSKTSVHLRSGHAGIEALCDTAKRFRCTVHDEALKKCQKAVVAHWTKIVPSSYTL